MSAIGRSETVAGHVSLHDPNQSVVTVGFSELQFVPALS